MGFSEETTPRLCSLYRYRYPSNVLYRYSGTIHLYLEKRRPCPAGQLPAWFSRRLQICSALSRLLPSEWSWLLCSKSALSRLLCSALSRLIFFAWSWLLCSAWSRLLCSALSRLLCSASRLLCPALSRLLCSASRLLCSARSRLLCSARSRLLCSVWGRLLCSARSRLLCSVWSRLLCSAWSHLLCPGRNRQVQLKNDLVRESRQKRILYGTIRHGRICNMQAKMSNKRFVCGQW